MKESDKNGLSRLIAIGAFEIGMEFLIHRLAASFNAKGNFDFMCDNHVESIYNICNWFSEKCTL